MAQKQVYTTEGILKNVTGSYYDAITVVDSVYIVKDITLDTIGRVLSYTFVEEIPITSSGNTNLSAYSGKFAQVSLGVQSKVYLLTDSSNAKIVSNTNSYAARINNVFEVLSAEMVDVSGFRLKINGSWKESDSSFIKVGGAWKEIERTFIKVNDIWREAE